MSNSHRTAPDHELSSWPPGVKYIVGNEGAERFSYYGMNAILLVYLTYLIGATGMSDEFAKAEANSQYHLFVAGVYAFPVIGGILADKLLGKYQTILWLSLVYCAGHAALSIFDGNLTGTYVGLALIGVGAGGIKPCVSAHVGDQFGKSNWHLINKVFQAFYFIINFGSFFATILVPILYIKWGAQVAFGLPGVLMFIATIVFWMGRHKFVHVPANPGGKLGILDTLVGFLLFVPLFMLLFAPKAGITEWWMRLLCAGAGVTAALMVFSYRQRVRESDGFLAVLVYSVGALFRKPRHEIGATEKDYDKNAAIAKHWFFGPAAKKYGNLNAEGPLAVFRIISVFFLVSVFWMLFKQHGSTWLRQAQQMDLDLGLFTIEATQVPSLNPILVMMLIPLMTFIIFPAIERRGLRLTPLRKMTVGMMFTSSSFVAVALIQSRIGTAGDGTISVAWQIIPYVLLTIGEVLVSITGLEFAYTQAPKRMKSIVMSFWLLCVSFGSWGVSLLAHTWQGEKAFWIFAGMMFGAGVLFGLRALFYTYKEYPQE